jgi:hypothetical protein
MARLRIFLIYLLLALVAAGVFGALHDQISYTVSREYFTRFKFIQFDLLEPGVPERLRAAWGGFLASWWMGIPIGLLTGVAGFIHRTPGQMRRALLGSLPLILGFALLFALGGLVYGYWQTRTIDLAAYQGWFIPPRLEHLRRFLCAGYMHNSAYLGGVLAIPIAWIFHLELKRRVADEA